MTPYDGAIAAARTCYSPRVIAAAEVTDSQRDLIGALTFDAEHKPCANGKPAPGSPVRISVWEIHPVYAVDVCKYTTLARCKVTDDSAWTPFDKSQAK